MIRITNILCGLILFGFAALVQAADTGDTREVAGDKSAFHLFNPTPVEWMRPMTVDGPGETDSPYTVDAGHFQVEMILVGYSSYKETFEGVPYRYDWWSVGPIAIKAGLYNAMDVQLVLEPYNHSYEREHGYSQVTRSGFGDTTLRLKFNLWGNDGGRTALAVMPYFRFPTSDEGLGNTSLEAGLILPFAMALPGDFHLGMTSSAGKLKSEGESQYHMEYRNSISVGRELFWDLEGYVEFFSAVSTEAEVGWAGTFNSGLLYWLTDDLQVNAGVEIGLTSWADDWFGFIGMAWRY